MDRDNIRQALRAPFGREYFGFKPGDGKKKWFPYFEIDAYIERLCEATGDEWDLEIGNWEWRDRVVVVYGHLTIPGLGRRACVGIQEFQSKAGNEMAPDMIKGVRADLIKNGFGAFAPDPARRMDTIAFDPDDPRNRDRLDKYLAHYFPDQQPAPSPVVSSPALAAQSGALTTTTPRPLSRIADPDGTCPICRGHFCNCLSVARPSTRSAAA